MTLRRGCGEQGGQGLVEFAMLLPAFLLVVFAIFEFGNLFRVQIELQNAVREGAHYMSINASSDASLQSDVQTTVQNAASDLAGVSVSICYPTPGTTTCGATSACGPANPAPAEVRVTAKYTYSAITPIGALLQKFGGSFGSGNAIALTASSTLDNQC